MIMHIHHIPFQTANCRAEEPHHRLARSRALTHSLAHTGRRSCSRPVYVGSEQKFNLMLALTHPSTTHTCAANQLRRVH